MAFRWCRCWRNFCWAVVLGLVAVDVLDFWNRARCSCGVVDDHSALSSTKPGSQGTHFQEESGRA
jgi:hypothetical protein